MTSRVVCFVPDGNEDLVGHVRLEYDVQVVSSALEALRIAESLPVPDLVLLDLILPNKDAYEVCVRLKQSSITKMIPVVIVAANSQDADEIKGFEMGATDFIPKPVSPPLLLARIRTRLALGSVLRELEKENDLLSKNLRLREDVERISRHDLKGPLTAVINIQRMLLQGKNLAPNQIELLGQLSESAHRMLEMAMPGKRRRNLARRSENKRVS